MWNLSVERDAFDRELKDPGSNPSTVECVSFSTEKFQIFEIWIYALFYNDDSKKYLKSSDNLDAMKIIFSRLKIFRCHNTRSEKLYKTVVYIIVNFNTIHSKSSYTYILSKVWYFAT